MMGSRAEVSPNGNSPSSNDTVIFEGIVITTPFYQMTSSHRAPEDVSLLPPRALSPAKPAWTSSFFKS
eukprot:4079192-Amphidinium_carterae.1